TRLRLAIFLARSPIRSSSALIFSAANVARRSVASGWRSANRRMTLRSRSACAASTCLSRSITFSASDGSRLTTAWMESATMLSAMPPMRAISVDSASSSSPKDLTICSAISLSPSAEPARDVVLRPRVARIGENLLGRTGLDQLAEMEERGLLRHARGLRHRMRHDHDAEILAQLVDQFLDLRRGD